MKDSDDVPCGHLEDRLDAADAGQLSAQREEGSSPPFALSRGLRQPADPDGEAADDQRNDQHHCERDDVLGITDGKGQIGWNEEEVKSGDAQK